MYASTVIISLRNVAACLIQLFLDIFFSFTLLWPCHYFPCAAVNVSNDYDKQPSRGTLSLLSQLWESRGSGVSSPPRVISVLQTWIAATACHSLWIPGYPTADISCFWLCGSFLKAILSGQIENSWLECNIPQEKKSLPLQYVCMLPSVYKTSALPWNTSAALLFLAVCSLKWSQAYLSKSQRG